MFQIMIPFTILLEPDHTTKSNTDCFIVSPIDKEAYLIFKQYSTSASEVGKGYSQGWCSAVATRPEAKWPGHYVY